MNLILRPPSRSKLLEIILIWLGVASISWTRFDGGVAHAVNAPAVESTLLGYPTQLAWGSEHITSLMPDNATWDDMTSLNSISVHHWVRLGWASAPGHSENIIYPYGSQAALLADRKPKPTYVFNGTTFWVNDWQVIGHAMSDICLVQALSAAARGKRGTDISSLRIDRVVLQRLPCGRRNPVCVKDHKIDPWFKFFYTVIFGAFSAPHSLLPPPTLYVRRNDESDTPTYEGYQLTWDASDGSVHAIHQAHDVISLHGYDSDPGFETLLRKFKYANQVSPAAAAAVKAEAYRLISTRFNTSYPHNFSSSDGGNADAGAASLLPPILITYLHRDLAANQRAPTNPGALAAALRAAFPPPRFDVQQVSANASFSGDVTGQVALHARSQVVVSDHGGAQSNLMFMRRGALVVDLRGFYYTQGGLEAANMFSDFAVNFGVYMKYVVTSNLRGHYQPKYDITDEEISQVVRIVKSYFDSKPYLNFSRSNGH